MALPKLGRWVLVLAVAGAVLACTKHEVAPEPVRPVQLVQVKLGAPGEAAVFAGEIKPRHETDLGFRIGGKVIARLVDVGGRVKKGQPLARLDPADVGLQAEDRPGRCLRNGSSWGSTRSGRPSCHRGALHTFEHARRTVRT